LQFTETLDIIEWAFSIHKIKFIRIDGSTNANERQPRIDTFHSDSTIKVFLLTTKAGGVGLNLTAADNVILFDHDWNPTNDAQAEDRAHRMGQTRKVMVHRLYTEGSIELHMAAIACNKWSVATELMQLSERARVSPARRSIAST
jgi:SNF2 family DNA or RNA helicase